VARRAPTDGTVVHLRLRRLLARAGVACLVASAVCFASEGVLLAAPLLAVDLHLPLAQVIADVTASPSPSPSPSASPGPAARRRSFLGEGPIVFAGTGTYQLGVNRSTRDGLALGYDNYSTALTLTVERRTQQSSIEVSDSFGVGSGALSSGSFIVAYRTPIYTLGYGQLAGPADTQLGIGGFARGISLTTPLRNGDLAYMSAIAQNQNEQTFRIYGLRRDWTGLGGYFGASGYYGFGEQGGTERIIDLSFQRYGAKLSTQTELAIGSDDGVFESPNGTRFAAGFQADLQGKNAFETLGLRYDPAGFNSLTGELDAGLSLDLALRRQGNFGNVSLDFTHLDDRPESTTTDAQEEHTDDVTLNGGKSWGHFGLEYVASFESTRLPGSNTLNRSAGVTATEQIKTLSLFASIQRASASSNTGVADTSQESFCRSRPMLGGSIANHATKSAETGGGLSTGTAVDQTLEYHRAIGRKTDVEFSQGLESAVNNSVRSRLIESQVTVVRKLSPVVSVQVSGDLYHQTGPGGGTGTGFTFSLVGPFGFGQPQTGGRGNPHLPAVIRGIVTSVASQTPFALNSTAQRGLNNALIILDNGITERTDSAGNFEFRFVPQGTHVVRVDPASLAPGLVLDREYQTINALGGTVTTLQFNVGNFAAVAGDVYAAGPNGLRVPLGKIGIAVDGVQATTTTPDGHYQVGRLNPGSHTVEIVTATVPGTVAFVSDTKKTVSVVAGSQTPLDFVASTLGSIAGFVYAATEGGFGPQTGMHNVYVVAEPGEHASITDDDGSFLLDNMPPGTYTLSVDPDTVPDGMAVLAGPDGPVDLASGAAVSGIVFRIGASAKSVVFTFDQGKRQPVQVTTDPAVVPPGGLIRLTARASAKDLTALSVESDVFGTFPLHLDRASGVWTGSTIAPSLPKGDYALTVTAHRKDISETSILVKVDPGVPLSSVRVFPTKPLPGHTVKVSLKSYAPLSEGDTVLFEDGYKVLLPKPSGRLFVFDVRLWQRGLPYSAMVVTKRGQNYPISLR